MQPATKPPVDKKEVTKVPPLRQDLEVVEGWPLHSGEPTWMLFDPMRSKYFRLSRTYFMLLSYWGLQEIHHIKEAVQRRLQRSVSDDELGGLIKFLFANELASVSVREGYKSFLDKENSSKKGTFKTVLHSYLFFKIPLFRPQRFLETTWPFVRFFFSKWAVRFLIFIAILGLYLVSRQWGVFQAQFASFMSFEGILFYGFSLVFVKVCHELGHAYVAWRHGIKVPIIGLAFLVLMPILYTDTSNAWRLRSRRQRLLIDAGGIMTELGLASIATIMWVFLPDGLARSTAFSIAAVSWVLSLLVNLNPFMRFDGYYILSDFLGVENLQSRGFDLARWKLREILFGLGTKPPEQLTATLQRSLILHAWGTWIYRFFLFLGIAFLIYTFFIKAVALFLFVVEIAWFIALPILKEIQKWWAMREDIMKSKRSYVSFGLLTFCAFLFFAPLSKTVKVPATMHAAQEVAVYPPHAGKLTGLFVSDGRHVSKGEKLAEIFSEDLTLNVVLLKKRIALLERRIARGNADHLDGADRRVLMSELAGLQRELDSLIKRNQELTIRAQSDGVIVDLDPSIHEGRHVSQTTQMFRIRGTSGVQISALIPEMEVARIQKATAGIFYPDDLRLPSWSVELKSLNRTATVMLDFPSLADSFGGTIQTTQQSSPKEPLKLMASYYGAELEGVAQPAHALSQTQRGIVHLEAEPLSYATRVWRRIVSVLRRESGF